MVTDQFLSIHYCVKAFYVFRCGVFVGLLHKYSIRLVPVRVYFSVWVDFF